MDDKQSFAAWLRQKRKEQGLTQEVLAGLAGCSGVYLRKIEAGERQPTRQIVEGLLDALQLPKAEWPTYIGMAFATPSRLTDKPLTNLPASLTPLIGRDTELAAIKDLVRQDTVRLVILTGPGGTGKTHLSLQVAADLLDQFSDGAFFVDLALLTDPDLIIPTIAEALGVKEQIGRSPLNTLKNYLRQKHLLLLVDNFEQVMSAAPLLAELLAAAPRVKALVTSREALHVRGEREFPVPPLPTPRVGTGARQAGVGYAAEVSEFPAVELFVRHAANVLPDFRLTNDNAAAVAEICYRLDGLPLAIELAAARIKLFPPHILLQRLVGRYGSTSIGLLTGGSRDLPSRQRTLHTTIEWSYNLLDVHEQRLFRHLAAFPGGWTVSAAEAVIGGEVVDALTSLMDKNLVRALSSGASSNHGPETQEPRFAMLDTIRAYARERLAESGEEAEVRRRHAAYYLDLAKAAEPYLASSGRDAWLEALEAEYGNLQGALRITQREYANPPEPRDATLALDLAGRLFWFWRFRHLTEGRRWLDVVLASDCAECGVVGAKALYALASLAWIQGDYPAARLAAEESLALAQEAKAETQIAYSTMVLGQVALSEGNGEPGRALVEESVDLFRRSGDRWGLAMALQVLGVTANAVGDTVAASTALEESLSLFQAMRDEWGMSLVLNGLGRVADAQGDYDAAREWYEEGLVLRRKAGDEWLVATSLSLLGNLALRQQDNERASECFLEAVRLYRDLGDVPGTTACENTLARLGVTVDE
ncbi:MAG: tetratricopeptide repeat protein [Anaerolineae bacterium]